MHSMEFIKIMKEIYPRECDRVHISFLSENLMGETAI